MIRVPDLINLALDRSAGLASAVRHTFDRFEPWLAQSGTPFFPGYTDHGPRHISEVLTTAASIISDASRSLIGPEDAAVLCMSVLLHDCGMHLTQDGFRALIQQDNVFTSGLGDQPWPRLWKGFLSDASRFGEEKLLAIFGSAEPYRTDLLDLGDLSERDCLLIGEFIRLHHARLAHDIALTGVPTKTANPLRLIGLSDDLCDISGLIARSHNMSIRSTFDYIERYGLIPESRRVKIPYLMAVLRIADYIQVHSERADEALLAVKDIRSPISRQEWRTHFAVKDVSTRHSDPEALYIHAQPEDVKTYLKLTHLLKDIQRELDESWATLGEVYGRQGDLAHLGLTMRRIRSNLESDRVNFPFIPIHAKFDASGSSLLKLLVGPLYNYEHRIAIRELLQNSIDACRELIDFNSQRGFVTAPADEPQVIVEIYEADDGSGSVTITDTGIGMTLETVTRYFLIAGASFRNSDLWKRQHLDTKGDARILRGGRFGIGALAAFLIGEEIEVTTRHVSCASSGGIEFKAKIDDAALELRACSASVGTTIRIVVSDAQKIDGLRPSLGSSSEGPHVLQEWSAVDWFLQPSPRVTFKWNGFTRARSRYPEAQRRRAEFRPYRNPIVPMAGKLDEHWHAIADPGLYKAIYWSYSEGNKQRSRGHYVELVTVNGIRVEQGRGFLAITESAPPLRHNIFRPSIAIFDPAAVCPINLQRNAVSFDRMGIDNQLARAVLTEHVKNVQKLAEGREDLPGLMKLCMELRSWRNVSYDSQVYPICGTRFGYLLASPRFLSQLGMTTLFFVDAPEDGPQLNLLQLRDDEAVLLRNKQVGKQAYLEWFRSFCRVTNQFGYFEGHTGFPHVSRLSAAAVIRRSDWQLVTTGKRVSKGILARCSPRELDSNRMLITINDRGGAYPAESRLQELTAACGKGADIYSWIVGEYKGVSNGNSLLEEVWLEVVQKMFLMNAK